MKTIKICNELGNDEVSLEIGNYQNNNCLYIGLFDENMELWGDLTINLSGSVPDYCAYVDINNFPESEKFIEENELGSFTGINGKSGFCTYPLYQFNKEKLRELCPEGAKAYEMATGIHEQEKNSIDKDKTDEMLLRRRGKCH